MTVAPRSLVAKLALNFDTWVSSVLNTGKSFRERCIAWGCLKAHCADRLGDERLTGVEQSLVEELKAVVNDAQELLGERVAAFCMLRDDFQGMLATDTLESLDSMLFEACLVRADNENLSVELRTVACGFFQRLAPRIDDDHVALVTSRLKAINETEYKKFATIRVKADA